MTDVFVLPTSENWRKCQMTNQCVVFLTSVKFAKGQMSPSVQGVRASNCSTIDESSNVLCFPRGRPRFCSERRPMCSVFQSELLGPWGLHEELIKLRVLSISKMSSPNILTGRMLLTSMKTGEKSNDQGVRASNLCQTAERLNVPRCSCF